MRWISCVLFTLGCATATEQDVLNTKKPQDSGVDTATDTGPVEDTAKPLCDGKEGATCKTGQTRSAACGNCGTVTDTCDPDTCTWVPGKCAGEGPCEAGFVEKTDCATAGEQKQRTCSMTCTWGEYSACGVLNPWSMLPTPPTGFEGRYFHSAVWTGTEMIVFGGKGATSAKKDGAAYDPVTKMWRLIAAPPASFSKGRWQHSAVWTGTKMIVWGGIDTDSFYATTNAAYDPKTDTWSDVKAVSISARTGESAVWTGTEMLIWGGGYNDGASYDPATDTWTLIPASPLSVRSGQHAVWNGSALIVWSGCPGGVICANDGASYDPKTKTWTKLPAAPSDMDGRYGAVAVALGTKALFWSGYGGTDLPTLIKKTGAIYDPASGWTSMATAETVVPPGGGRELAMSWVAGGKVYVFGGRVSSEPKAQNGGGIYDVTTNKWSAMPTADAPEGRMHGTVVFTGTDALIWGGTKFPGDAPSILRDGAKYHPAP
jgi:N-acetylneuraminic acid mutarotase